MSATPISRRKLLQGSAALASALWLPRARACEFFAANLRITHPWTRATPQDMPYASVSMKIDEVTQDERLIGAETPVAERVELAGPGLQGPLDLALPAGRELLLNEAGIHLRLLGLKQPLEIACTYPLHLTFERSGRVRTDLSVDYTRFR